MCALLGNNVDTITQTLSRVLQTPVTPSTTIEQLYWRMHRLAQRVGPPSEQEQVILTCYNALQ